MAETGLSNDYFVTKQKPYPVKTSDLDSMNNYLNQTSTEVRVVAKGGTGLSAYVIGDLIYASTTSVLSKLAGVATGSYLASGGVGVAPSWATLNQSVVVDLKVTDAVLFASFSTTTTIVSGSTVTATTGLITDTISELTPDDGVTADNVQLKDGKIIGKLSTSQLDLQLTTGLPMILHANKVLVTNLNADQADGYDFDQEVKQASNVNFGTGTFAGVVSWPSGNSTQSNTAYTHSQDTVTANPHSIAHADLDGIDSLQHQAWATSGAGTIHINNIQDSSTGQQGVVQLSTSISSSSTTLAGTSSAVKSAYDRGSTGVANAATAQSNIDTHEALTSGMHGFGVITNSPAINQSLLSSSSPSFNALSVSTINSMYPIQVDRRLYISPNDCEYSDTLGTVSFGTAHGNYAKLTVSGGYYRYIYFSGTIPWHQTGTTMWIQPFFGYDTAADTSFKIEVNIGAISPPGTLAHNVADPVVSSTTSTGSSTSYINVTQISVTDSDIQKGRYFYGRLQFGSSGYTITQNVRFYGMEIIFYTAI